MFKKSMLFVFLLSLSVFGSQAQADEAQQGYSQVDAIRLSQYLAGQSLVCDPITDKFAKMPQAEKLKAFASSFTLSARQLENVKTEPTLVSNPEDRGFSGSDESIYQLNVGPEFIFLAAGDDGPSLLVLPFEPNTDDPQFPEEKFCMDGRVTDS